jgi:hypothetical protein
VIFTHQVIGPVLALGLLIPTGAAAQALDTEPDPPLRDSLALGVSLCPALAGGVGFWPTFRVGAPLGTRIAVDLDAGRMFPADNGYFSTRRYYALQFRFLRRPRDAKGSSRFWLVGPALMIGSDLDGHGLVTDPYARIGAIRVAYGGDRIYSNGMRAAGEIGAIGGGSSAPTGVFASLIVQWRPRH